MKPATKEADMRARKAALALLLIFCATGCANTDYKRSSVVNPELVSKTLNDYQKLEEDFYVAHGEMNLYFPDVVKIFPFLKPEKKHKKIENEKPEIKIECSYFMENEALQNWILRQAFQSVDKTGERFEPISFKKVIATDVVNLVVFQCPLDYTINYNPGGLRNFFLGYEEFNDGYIGKLSFAFIREEGDKLRLIGLKKSGGSPAAIQGTIDNIVNRAAGGLGGVMMGGVNRGISLIK